MASALGRNRRSAPSAPPREALPGDNLSPEERRKAEEEQEKLGLISVVSAINVLDPKIEAKAAELKALKDQKTSIFNRAKGDYGFKRKDVEEIVAASKVGNRKALSEDQARRDRWFRHMGLPTATSDEQRELEARLPEVERNAQYWRAEGYTAGISAGDLEPPAACIAAGHVGPFSQGVKDGQAANGATMKTLKDQKGKPKAEAPKEKTVAQEQAEARAAEKRAKESLEAMKPTDDNTGEIVDVDPLGVGQTAADFEPASDEELANQAGRPSTVAPEENEGV